MTNLRDTGSTFGKGDRYVISSVLHNGTFSQVYGVSDAKNGKLVVLKEVAAPVPDPKGRGKIAVDSLKRETRLMQPLTHPAIPRIIDVRDRTDKPGGKYSVLMDYIGGYDLAEAAKHTDSGRFSEQFVVSKMMQVATILQYLHTLTPDIHPGPLVHRDIKPKNIMYQNGSMVLMDYGLAEVITPDNQINTHNLGTKGYAPPEQITKGTPLNIRSDIYSFGMTMYQLLVGKLPESDHRGIPTGPVDAHAANPEVSRALSDVIAKCVALRPDDRYSSMVEVIAALTTYKTADSRHRAKHRRRIRTVGALAAAALIMAVASAGTYTYGANADANSYAALTSAAQKAGTVEAWEPVINARPSNIDSYFDTITAIKQGDGRFTSAEEAAFIPLVREHIKDIQDNPRYPELAYQIGELYWFFYTSDANADGLALSAPWFKDAISGNYNVEQASALYNMGSFNRDIASAIQTSSDTGMYRAYWNNLTSLNTDNSGEVVQLQLLNYIVDCINNYTYRLRTDGVPKADVDAQLERAKDYLTQHPNPTPGRPAELSAQLSTKLDQSRTLVDAVYAAEGATK